MHLVVYDISKSYAVRMHLVVYGISKCYDVIRVSKECVNVYSSVSNRWVCCSPYAHNARAYYSAHFNGCVYVMEEQQYCWCYMVRVYDIEWLGNPACVTFDYALKYGMSKEHCPSAVMLKEDRPIVARIPCAPIFVDCIGDFYLVGASIYQYMDLRGDEPPFPMKMLFYIFKLMQEGRLIEKPDHVVLPLETQVTHP
jgi:hypothetical protein